MSSESVGGNELPLSLDSEAQTALHHHPSYSSPQASPTNSKKARASRKHASIDVGPKSVSPDAAFHGRFLDEEDDSQNLADFVLSDEDFGDEQDHTSSSSIAIPEGGGSLFSSHLSLSTSTTDNTVRRNNTALSLQDHHHGGAGSTFAASMHHQMEEDTTTGSAPESDHLASIQEASAKKHPQSNQQQPPETPIIPTNSLFHFLKIWGGNSATNNRSMDEASEQPSSESDEEVSLSDDSCYDCDDDYDLVAAAAPPETNPWELPVDWDHLPVLPNRFCVTTTGGGSVGSAVKHPETPHYLDASLLQNAGSTLTAPQADSFVWEHGALLQAVLQLLAERDQVGVEGSMEHTDNIWKKGPLKKLSFAVGRRRGLRNAQNRSRGPAVAGAWKVKYAELRQGNLCYYEDSSTSASASSTSATSAASAMGATGRKTIHLRQADTVVQESSYRGPGFVFEMLVQGSPTRYFMASSEQERKEWIRAIQTAMIGDDGAPQKDLDLQPYQQSLQAYSALREALQKTNTQAAYLAAIQTTVKDGPRLQVPVQWIRERIEHELSPLLIGMLKPPKFGSPQKLLKSSIADFWKNMRQTTFSINGLTVSRKSQLASERILGSLARCILEFDKAFLSTAAEEREEAATVETAENTPATPITELQAVSYARNILLSVLRSKERQDTASAVKYLLETHGVMVFDDSGPDEPVNMEVSFAGEDLPDDFLPESEEMSAWVWTRIRRSKNASIAASVSSTVSSSKWKQRHTFAVLSGTVLSYYEAADPRPHGFRGQLVLTANTTVNEEGEEIVTTESLGGGGGVDASSGTRSKKTLHVLCIAPEKHQNRLLMFEHKEDAVAWKEAIKLAIESAGSSHKNPPRVVTTTVTTSLAAPAKMFVKGAERAIKVAADGTIQGGIRVIKGAKGGIRVAKDGGIRVIKTATGSGFKVIRGAVGMLRQNKSSNESGLERRPSMQILLNNTIVHGKQQPTVQCVVQTMQTYSVRDYNFTENSSSGYGTGAHEGDGWVSVQAKLYQAFLMSGGPSGRIARGDALVTLDFLDANVDEDVFDNGSSDDDDDSASQCHTGDEGLEERVTETAHPTEL